MGLRCKGCGGEEHVKNGFMRGKQRYRCKACGLNFTDTPLPGKPLAMKVTAVLLYVSGLSMNRTAKLLGVSTPTIQAWIEQFAKTYAQKPAPEGRAVVIELDEMWHYLKKKSNQLWIWKAWDRATGRLVDWECGGRDAATAQRLIERLNRWRTRLYCADDYAVYEVLLPVGRLYAGKDETHGIERDHARQRHWLARFRRRSIVVSKAKRMVDASIALFARFAGNDRIKDLLSMLT
ncbi:MAG TPA: IS1 family transposase [Gemmatimonadales bacterium]